MNQISTPSSQPPSSDEKSRYMDEFLAQLEELSVELNEPLERVRAALKAFLEIDTINGLHSSRKQYQQLAHRIERFVQELENKHGCGSDAIHAALLIKLENLITPKEFIEKITANKREVLGDILNNVTDIDDLDALMAIAEAYDDDRQEDVFSLAEKISEFGDYADMRRELRALLEAEQPAMGTPSEVLRESETGVPNLPATDNAQSVNNLNEFIVRLSREQRQLLNDYIKMPNKMRETNEIKFLHIELPTSNGPKFWEVVEAASALQEKFNLSGQELKLSLEAGLSDENLLLEAQELAKISIAPSSPPSESSGPRSFLRRLFGREK